MEDVQFQRIVRDDYWYGLRLEEMGASPDTLKKFFGYKNRNVHAWLEFEYQTFKAIEAGEQVTAKGIGERVRESDNFQRSGNEPKICNTWIPYFARIFMLKHDDKLPHNKYFKLNPLKGAE